MITQTGKPTIYLPDEPYYYDTGRTTETERLSAPASPLPSVLPLLMVGVSFLACLAAIAAGVWLTIQSNSHAIAVLAALGCAGMIYGLLSPRKER